MVLDTSVIWRLFLPAYRPFWKIICLQLAFIQLEKKDKKETNKRKKKGKKIIQ